MKRSHLAAITFSMVLALLVSFSVANAQTINPEDWQYRKAITIDHTQVSAPAPDTALPDFPLLVKTSDAHLRANAQTTGIDILFTADDGISLLDYEIESYSDTTELVAWVRIPTLDNTADTTIYMYYGNPSAVSSLESPAAVWDSNYVMVQHLEETSGDHFDSTDNDNDGTTVVVTPQDATGIINGADDFDGVDDYVRVPNADSLQFGEGSFTAEAWIYPESAPSSGGARIVENRGTGSPVAGWQLKIVESSGNWKVDLSRIEDASGNFLSYTGTTTYTYNQWYRLVMVYEADNELRFYVNGDSDGTLYVGSFVGDITNGLPTVIGASLASYGTEGGAPTQEFKGKIDEVRISNVERSFEWITTEFKNQSDPGSFYTVCSPESEYPFVSNPVPVDSANGVSITTTQLCFDLEDQQSNMNYIVTTNPDIGSGGVYGVPDGNYCISVSGLAYDTTYEWTVTVDDGNGHETINTYNFTTEREPAPWWNCEWSYRKKIVIDHAQGPEDLNDFPVLIEFTDDTDVDMNAEPNGADIIFTDYDGTILLDHEIEYYASGSLVAWVRIDPLSATTDTVIYMYYGNPNPPIAGDPTEVWDDNYVMVQHLNETTGGHLDSKLNNDGTPSVTAQGSDLGKIDGADEFDGTDYIDCGNDDSLDITGSMTVEAWAFSNNGEAQPARIVAKDNVGIPGKFILWKNNDTTPKLAFLVRGSNDVWYRAKGDPITDGEWFHVVGVFDADNNQVRLYKDGGEVVPVGSPSISLNSPTTENVTIGASQDKDDPMLWKHLWKGIIDEVRISKTVRSTGWIQTSYTNQNDPSSFLVIGDEEEICTTIGDITGPAEPTPVDTEVMVTADLIGPLCDPITITFDWGDTSSIEEVEVDPVSKTATGTHIYNNPGVYTIEVIVDEDNVICDVTTYSYQYIVVYDPSGGFVTGGGWIDSPAGAYTPDPELTGKANFGFVSKYKKGATVPTGETEFQFNVADLNFHSDTYQWLVIAGARAKYKGTGTINGGGNYGFMLTAIDEKLTESTDDVVVDMFRIKIWDKDYGDAIVYDNQFGDADDAEPATEIGGGSIVIHKGKK